jgi:poly-gamma-glutamate synthesis protein (capsule biosynthesis protein)
MTGSARLVACGDIGPIHEPVDQYGVLVQPALDEADIRFAQCERVYSDRGEFQINSAGEHSRLRPDMASVFSTGGYDVVSVASNHSLDWGPTALLDSIEVLRARGIKTIGAGRDLAEARQPAYVEANGVKVGFLGYCSVLREGYAAGPGKPGVAPIRAHTYYEPTEYQAGVPPRVVTVAYEEDLANLLEDVAAVRADADVVVVSIHWGIHFIPKMIADYQRQVAAAVAEAGADLLVGHHAHVPKAVEVHGKMACFYSLSNFIMTAPELDAAGVARFSKRFGVEMDPAYPRLPYGTDGKRTLMVRATLSTSGVDEVSFQPVLIDQQLRPEPLVATDSRFGEALQYMEWASDEVPHTFTVRGDDIVVTA